METCRGKIVPKLFQISSKYFKLFFQYRNCKHAIHSVSCKQVVTFSKEKLHSSKQKEWQKQRAEIWIGHVRHGTRAIRTMHKQWNSQPGFQRILSYLSITSQQPLHCNIIINDIFYLNILLKQKETSTTALKIANR